MPKKTYTLEKVSAILHNYNFKLISKHDSMLASTSIVIRCLNCLAEKNIKKSRSVNYGIRCRKCNPVNTTYTIKYSIDIIEKNGYNVLNVKGKNHNLSNAQYEIQCKICNNIKIINSIPGLTRNPRCIKCYYKTSSKISKEEFENKIKTKNLILIGEYINTNRSVNIKCLKCNIITNYNKANSIYKKPTCKICIKHVKNNRFNIDHVKNICIEHDLIFLDNNYINAHEKHNFKCDFGHIFNDSVTGIIHKKRGCKICNPYGVNESLINRYLTKLSPNLNIIKQYRLNKQIIVDDKIVQNNIIVDYFIKPNIIIEYNGEQHYKPITFGSQTKEEAKKSFNRQLIRDNWLRNYCQENSLLLFEIDGRTIKGLKILNYLKDNIISIL